MRAHRFATGLLAAVLLAVAVPAAGLPIDITGTFQYEDREWDQFGFTGTVQNLPIPHADVEVVRALGGAVIGTGSTDADGNFSITVELDPGNKSVYVRCLATTDGHPDYHIKVVDTFVRTGGTVDLSGSTIHAIVTPNKNVDSSNPPTGDFGTYVIQDTTGSGVAQAFNILGNAVDGFDYLASASGINRFPTVGEFVVFGWNFTSGSSGSNYFWQGIYITATGSDTDGWADTVILHEMGHWANDMFTRDNNPGGSHFIGDNFQDPRLSYGEGYATFFCAQVREFAGSPPSPHVSIYADLGIPPLPPSTGSLEFAYDFETGLFQTGSPIGQIGSANETNVTSAMWDLVDGPGTADESPGVDDDPADETGSLSWAVLENYMVTRGDVDWLTVEDFYDGWFVEHGAGFMQAEVDSAFIGLAGMEFYADAFEPDDTIAQAPTDTCLTYAAAGSHLVINECDQGPEDKIEIYNPTNAPVNLATWTITANRNGFAPSVYTFPSFTLYPGSFVVVHEGGNAANNNQVHLYEASFSVVWFNGDDGSCALADGGGNNVDYVEWDNVSGSDPHGSPPPAGAVWTGTLFSAPGGKNIARDKDGTDTDDASDFASRDASMGAPNFDVVPHHTIYPEGDADVVCLDLTAGDLAVVRAESQHSAGEPLLQLLNASGAIGGTAKDSYGIRGLAELQFIVPSDTTVYVRAVNDAPYTFYAPLDLAVYKRPSADVLVPPIALIADPENLVDLSDIVELSWFNGGNYDSVEVWRGGGPIASLAGNAVSYTDAADRGLYTYGVRGFLGGPATPLFNYRTFAGTIECFTAETFEGGSGNLISDAPWAITGTLASEGAFSLHDSPAGDYGNNLDIATEIIEPAEMLTATTLEFDHICITEATFDFGYVEISTDFGNSWTQLAAYDMDDHPQWNDGTASPGDWVHESIDLTAYTGENVRVRFRLVTDPFVTEDGWYVDNVTLSDSTCTASTAVPDDVAGARPVLSAFPNPFGSSLTLSFDLPSAETGRVLVFDARGRLVRTLHEGRLERGASLVWDGLTDAGRRSAAGFYLVRVTTPGADLVRRVVKLR